MAATAALWPAVALTFGCVHRAAGILGTKEIDAAMARHRPASGNLAGAVGHFLKVSRSYWPGLFACNRVAHLPRTNNDLERCFGSRRYRERPATGRKVASPALVLRGSASIVAAYICCPPSLLRPARAVDRAARVPYTGFILSKA